MKIGIFGGSFNPPHNMHTEIADYMIKQHYVDKVVFVPTGSKYAYKNNLIEEEHRYNMLDILNKKNANIMVSDYELKSEVVYTIDTLRHFKEEYPNDEICFICGLDNFSYIDKWKNGEEILTNYKIVVINRDGNDLEELLVKYDKYRDNIIISNMEMKDISSTYIRDNIGEIDKVKEYLDEDVLRYIQENNLYR